MKASYKRLSFIFLPLMALVIPLWLTLGRAGLFGVGGWGLLVIMFTIAPGLLIVLLLLYGILLARPGVRRLKQTGTLDGILLLSLYLSTILFGIFLVDGDDTKESLNSVASKYMGISLADSDIITLVFLYASLALILATFIVFTVEAVTKRPIGSKEQATTDVAAN
jgi:hypothetical protein